MKLPAPIFLLVLLLGTLAGSVSATSPVIGIFSQPLYGSNTTDNYIAASYVKWLEVGGARSVVVPFAADEAVLDDIFDQINGLLIPGGSANISSSIRYMLDKAVEANNNGDFFPVWGTCMGFEFLIEYFGGPTALQHNAFLAENRSLPLYEVQWKTLYADLEMYRLVTTENVTMNNHHDGIEPENFLSNDKLTSRFAMTSVSVDDRGLGFVSTIEPLEPDVFPFYGTQYHPEKNAFEYATFPDSNIPYEAINHSPGGVQLSFYTAGFFVNLARQNLEAGKHQFTGNLAYVYTYPIAAGLKFEQVYLIPADQEEDVAAESESVGLSRRLRGPTGTERRMYRA